MCVCAHVRVCLHLCVMHSLQDYSKGRITFFFVSFSFFSFFLFFLTLLLFLTGLINTDTLTCTFWVYHFNVLTLVWKISAADLT